MIKTVTEFLNGEHFKVFSSLYQEVSDLTVIGKTLYHIKEPFLGSFFQKKVARHLNWLPWIILRLRLTWSSWVENRHHLGAKPGSREAGPQSVNFYVFISKRNSCLTLCTLMHDRKDKILSPIWDKRRFFNCPLHKGLVKPPWRCIVSLGTKWRRIEREGLVCRLGAMEKSLPILVPRISLAQGSADRKRFETKSSAKNQTDAICLPSFLCFHQLCPSSWFAPGKAQVLPEQLWISEGRLMAVSPRWCSLAAWWLVFSFLHCQLHSFGRILFIFKSVRETARSVAVLRERCHITRCSSD